MLAFLAEWGIEILFGLTSAIVIGFAKYYNDKTLKEAKEYKDLLAEKEEQKLDEKMDTKLEMVYEELEDLRAYIRDTKNVETTHISLIVASYRYRLIQLCKLYIQQKYVTQQHYDDLMEFYKVYTGLGGNGQAVEYYNSAIMLPIVSED